MPRQNHALDSFNTQPPEGGWSVGSVRMYARRRFNTQPPEGGWRLMFFNERVLLCFNTQPPEGGWVFSVHWFDDFLEVSTHSRLKAAGSRVNR